jgi:hypothetical protein
MLLQSPALVEVLNDEAAALRQTVDTMVKKGGDYSELRVLAETIENIQRGPGSLRKGQPKREPPTCLMRSRNSTPPLII